MSIQCVALFGNQDRAGPPGLSLVTTKTIPTYRTRGPRREAAPTPPPGRWPACTSRGWPDILQKQVRPGGLIRKCVPQETGIGTRTGCHVKWKPHAKSSPGFCNTKTGARCRQQPAYENGQAAIWKHLRARQRPAKISDIGKPNVPKHSNPEHYGSGLTLDEPLSISGTRVPRAYAAATSLGPFSGCMQIFDPAPAGKVSAR